MLDVIRNNKKTMLVLLVLLVIPSFVIFGVNFNFSSGGTNDLAHVGPNQITYANLENQMQQIRRNNPGVDLRELEQPEVKMSVLREIVADVLWKTAANDHRLVVSDQAVRAKLVTLPFLQELMDENGRIDPELYKSAIMRMGYQAHDFENLVIRPEIMAERMRLPVKFGFTSRIDVEQYMQFVDSRYVLRQQAFDFQQFTDDVTVTPEELQARYDEHKQLFVEPAYADIEYVVFDTSTLGGNLSKEELRVYYEQNKQLFNIPEERKISHILLEGDGAEQKAKDLLEELRKDPSRFAETAKNQSSDTTSASNGGDLGYITQGMMTPLDGVAFSLGSVGAISGVVKSSYGYHIIMLTDIRKASSFDEIFPLIESDLRRQVAAPLSAKAVERFVSAVTAQNDSFEDVAKEFNLKIEYAQHIAQQPALEAVGVLGNADFLNAIFAPNVLNSAKNIMPVKVGATQLASARVLNYAPESIKPLSAVEEQVKAMVVQEKAIAQAELEAGDLLGQWQATPEMANEADEVSFTQGEVIQWLNAIQEQQVDANVMMMLQEIYVVAEKAFQYSSASELPESFMVQLPNRGYIVAQLQRIDVPEKMDEALFKQRAIGLGEVISTSQGNAVQSSMEKEFDVAIYPQTMEKLRNN